MSRSNTLAVRNPLTTLPSAAKLAAMPAELRAVWRSLMLEISADALAKAEKAWKKKKGPMACYWKATSVYAKHLARLAK